MDVSKKTSSKNDDEFFEKTSSKNDDGFFKGDLIKKQWIFQKDLIKNDGFFKKTSSKNDGGFFKKTLSKTMGFSTVSYTHLTLPTIYSV